jgi:putative Mg2+ transporter-C (MgtC) family protein
VLTIRLCERRAETYVRALLLRALAGTGLTSTGLRATHEGQAVAALDVSFAPP